MAKIRNQYNQALHLTQDTCVKRPFSKIPQICFQNQLSLNVCQSTAECSWGSFLQYFRPSLSYYLSLRYYCLFLRGRHTRIHDFFRGGGGLGVQARRPETSLDIFSFSPQFIMQSGYNGFITEKTIFFQGSRGGPTFSSGGGGPAFSRRGRGGPNTIFYKKTYKL